MSNLDQFLDRNRRRDYTCADFAREVWLELTGDDLAQWLTDITGVPASQATVSLSTIRQASKGHKWLKAPEDPCLVFMRRPKAPAHVGVFVHGRVLHLGAHRPQWVDLHIASLGFTDVRYFR